MNALCIVDGIFGGVLLFCIPDKKKSIRHAFLEMREIWKYKYIILFFLCIFVLYTAFPTNYMLGGRDPGLYYLNGIHIARTGSIQYEEDLYLTDHYEELDGVVTPGYAGIYSDYKYGYSENAGKLTPQFMPMYSAAMAVGYDLGGISVMIRVNTWITVLSLLMIYFFVRRSFSEKTGLISVLMLAISPAQLWYGRNSVSELLLQLLIFLSVDLFQQGFEQKKKKYGIASGFLFGIGVMDRIDAYILGVGLIALLVYAILFSYRKRKYIFCSVIAYCVTGGAAFLYGIIFSRPYFHDHMHGILNRILFLNIGMLLVAGIIILIQFIVRKTTRKKVAQINYFFQIFENRIFVMMFFCLLLFIWIYAYFIRSIGVSTEDGTYFVKHNIVELSWYVSPIIMVLSILGLVGILYKRAEKQESVFLFLAVGISNYIGYGINPFISKDHIWAARRWITIIIPFLIIMGVLGIRTLYVWLQKKQPLVARVMCSCLIIGIIGYLLYQSKPFIITKIMENLDTELEALANQLEDNQLYITNNEEVASYLHYVYDKQVYYSTLENTEAIEQYINMHQELHYIGDYASIEDLECEKELVFFYETKGLFLEKLIGAYPRNLYERTREASIYYLNNSIQ
ncbi:MAG: glycosyltransferase family 39 protein [Bacteroides sp.]|nr:glycosyltransferase family 39 protein [Bacteroides sp.]MCM1548415.1 glycosyltransferase family 39 protein [Clostridium sp.]